MAFSNKASRFLKIIDHDSTHGSALNREFSVMQPIVWIKQLWEELAKMRKPESLGAAGERLAAKFLQRAGFEIVARGVRYRSGELDLVAVKRPLIVFVEVKTRNSQEHGHPAEAVDRHKQRRMISAAHQFIKKNELFEYPARFDIIAITHSDRKTPPKIEHFVDAFQDASVGIVQS
jgi:putative endonuclease